MSAQTVYRDKRGRLYLKVADTRSGIYAWYRPLKHRDDGYYDVHRRVADMTLHTQEIRA